MKNDFTPFSDLYFASIIATYKKSTVAKRQLIISHLSRFENPNNFLQFASSDLSNIDDTETLFDIANYYLSSMSFPINFNLFVQLNNLEISLLNIKPSFEYFELYSSTMTKIFQSFPSEALNNLYNFLESLPSEFSILPLSIFSTYHQEYFLVVFSLCISLLALPKCPILPTFLYSALVLFKSSIKCNFSEDGIKEAVISSINSKSIPLFLRFDLLSSVSTLLSFSTLFSIINKYYITLLEQLSPLSSIKDMESSACLQSKLSDIIQDKSCEKELKPLLMKGFLFILKVYHNTKDFDNFLINFCNHLTLDEIEKLILTFNKSFLNKTTNMITGMAFIISHFPSEKTLSLMLNPNYIQSQTSLCQMLYPSVIFYIKNNQIDITKLYLIFSLISFEDFQLLEHIYIKSDINQKSVFIQQIIMFLAQNNDLQKAINLSQFIYSHEPLPNHVKLDQKTILEAFVSTSLIALESAINPLVKNLIYVLEYLKFLYINFSKEEKIQFEFSHQNYEQICTGYDVVLYEFHNLNQEIKDFQSAIIELAFGYLVNNNNTIYALIIAVLNKESELFHTCGQILYSNISMLTLYFTTGVSIPENSTIALLEMNDFIMSNPEKPKTITSLSQKIKIGSKPDSFINRIGIVLRALMASTNLHFSQYILDILLIPFSNTKSNEMITISCEAITLIFNNLPCREFIDPLLSAICDSYSFADPSSFVSALIILLKRNKELTLSLAKKIALTWFSVLEKYPDFFSSNFEEVFLDNVFIKVSLQAYLSLLEKRLQNNEKNIVFYKSLEKIISFDFIDKHVFQPFIPLLISNSLSKEADGKIGRICLSLLKTLKGIPEDSISIDKNLEKNTDFRSTILSFFSVFASKFSVNESIFLLEILLKTECKKKLAILLCSHELIKKDPNAFINSKINFIFLIYSFGQNLKSSLMQDTWLLLRYLVEADPVLFIKKYLSIPPAQKKIPAHSFRNFVDIHLAKDFNITKPMFSTIFESVKNQLFKPNIDSLNMDLSFYLLHMTDFFLRYSEHSVLDDNESTCQILVIFVLYLSLSLQYRRYADDFSYFDILNQYLENINESFMINTGIALINSLDLSSEAGYQRALLKFSSSISKIPSIIEHFIQYLHDLKSTPFQSLILSLPASIAKYLEDQHYLSIVIHYLFNYLSQPIFSESLVEYTINAITSKLTPEIIVDFPWQTSEQLMESIMKFAAHIEGEKLHQILTITEVIALNLNSDEDKIVNLLNQMKSFVQGNQISLRDPLVLNILIHICEAGVNPGWFINQDPISYDSLAQLMVKDKSIRQHLTSLLSAILFRNSKELDKPIADDSESTPSLSNCQFQSTGTFEETTWEIIWKEVLRVYKENNSWRSYSEIVNHIVGTSKDLVIDKQTMILISKIALPLINEKGLVDIEAKKRFIQLLQEISMNCTEEILSIILNVLSLFAKSSLDRRASSASSQPGNIQKEELPKRQRSRSVIRNEKYPPPVPQKLKE